MITPNADTIKHLLQAHRDEIDHWLTLDITGMLDLLNRVAAGDLDAQQEQYADSVTEAADTIMAMLFSNAWNGVAVDPSFWDTDMGRVIQAVRFWIDYDELITISEAATILRGGTDKADLMYIRRLINSGKLAAYTDPGENNPTKSTRVSRAEVQTRTSRNRKKKPCIWNGVEYESVQAAADAIGIKKDTMLYRVKMGYMSDSDMERPEVFCTWNGIHYRSISEAARANKITFESMWGRLKSGYTSDDDMKHGPRHKD